MEDLLAEYFVPQEGPKVVDIKGTPWNYMEHGDTQGQALLNLHGWLGGTAKGNELIARTFAGELVNSLGMQELAKEKPETTEQLKSVLAGIKGKYHIFTPELPGFGITPPLETPTLDNIADAIFEFQKKFGIEKSVIFGSSLGAILAVKLAARHPKAVKTIILQGLIAKPDDMERVVYVATRIATTPPIEFVLDRLGLGKRIFRKFIKWGKDYKLASPEIQRLILSTTTRADVRTATQTMREVGTNLEKDIKNVKCPVIIIDGVNGEIVSTVKTERAALRFRRKVHPTVAHVPFLNPIVYLPVGGEHGHNIINTFPEAIVALVDPIFGRLTKTRILPPKPKDKVPRV